MSGNRVMADAGSVAFEEWNSSLKSCDGWSEALSKLESTQDRDVHLNASTGKCRGLPIMMRPPQD